MMMVAIMLRPWMLLMETLNATPRTLANDMLITTQGPHCINQVIATTTATHAYLDTMGAKVATSKSILFSSSQNGKQKLKKHK